MKTCFRCKQTKDVGLFFKHKQTSDGLHSWCKACCTEGNTRSRAKRDATIEGKAKTFWRNAQKSADKRGHEFSITLHDIVKAWHDQKQTCAYSGRQMTLVAGQLNTVSIERIDSKIGYTADNTILVCQAINRMKSDFEFEDFYALCVDVATFLGDNDFRLVVGERK